MFANKKDRCLNNCFHGDFFFFSVQVCDSRQDEKNYEKKEKMNEMPSSHVGGRKQFPRLNLVMQSLWASSTFGN